MEGIGGVANLNRVEFFLRWGKKIKGDETEDNI